MTVACIRLLLLTFSFFFHICIFLLWYLTLVTFYILEQNGPFSALPAIAGLVARLMNFLVFDTTCARSTFPPTLPKILFIKFAPKKFFLFSTIVISLVSILVFPLNCHARSLRRSIFF